MLFSLIFVAIVIVICVLLNDASNKVGVPVLLAFLLLGIATGATGLLRLDSEDLQFSQDTATVALIFIMFYGGFGTRWKSAKKIAVEAGILSTLGVLLTAAFTGLFCHFALGWKWVESFLMGSVISSTDAASVFSILRSRKLGLKNRTAPLLELESGSNDPLSNILTIVFLTMMKSNIGTGEVIWMFIAQLAFGAGLGLLIAQGALFAMKHIRFSTSGFDSLFVLAIAILAYAVPSTIGGNGYLSTYIVGIILGNQDFKNKKQLVGFFDGITGLMQVVIFYMLGLLAHPTQMNKVVLPSIAIFAFLLLIARPITVHVILQPFKKYHHKQQALISFVGLRGAASIVFAIMATVGNDYLDHDILNVVFCIVLLSISIQGFFIPIVARKLSMIDKDSDVMETFSDFSDQNDLQFSELKVSEDNNWAGKKIKDLGIPRNILICNVIRTDGSRFIPDGNTVLDIGDTIILCSLAFRSGHTLHILQHPVSMNSKWIGVKVKDLPATKDQLLMIQRGEKSIIPNGNTVIHQGDVLFINKS